MKINSLKGLRRLENKKIFLRVDFNVPIKEGKIKEDYKIVAGLETIKFLAAKGARLIIATHLGDPGGKYNQSLSIAPLALRLRKLSGLKVRFAGDICGEKASKASQALAPGEILFLENLRFAEGELADNIAFAKQLASLADIYVNDAFAVSHRAQASVSAIKKFLPAYAGLLLEKEVRALNKTLKPKKPLVTVMGGAKISTKIPLINSLYPVSSYILLGGGLANSFWKFQGQEIGRSLYDKDSAATIKKMMRGKSRDKKIILPVDVAVKTKNGQVLAKKLVDLKKTDTILDIGPETIALYAQYIKSAQTIVWNGPLGKFEDPHFKNGTLSMARLIASRANGRAYGLAGGGETVEALQMSGMMEYMDWVSTAGGAMLAYLGKEKMPGLKKIIS